MFREKLLYLAKGASICVFAGSLPRGMDSRRVRRIDPLGPQARRGDDDRYRRGASAPRGTGRAGCRIAETNSRPRSWSATSSTTSTIARRRLPRWTRLGRRRGDHDGARWLLRPTYSRGACPALYRVRVEEQEARSSIGSGDAFLAGYVAARYAGRAAVDCLRLRGCLRRGIDPALRGRNHRSGQGCQAPAGGRGRAPGDRRRDPLRTAGRAPEAVRAAASISGPMVALVPLPGAGPSARPHFPSRDAFLLCRNGSRNRTREEGPPGVWVRRDSDRSLTPDARSRRR